MNVVGIDVGYSNLKLAYGPAQGKMKILIRPAGAAPKEHFGTRFDGRSQDDFLHVTVDGQDFIAGVSTDRAEMWERSLHADYAKTDSYKALFNAGLLLTEMKEIDVLVTGLPVSQFQDDQLRADLVARFTGEHRVTQKRTVTVKQVKVVAQPIGGLLDYVNQVADGPEEERITDEHRILVVDPGFYSLDWVLVSNGQLQRQSSGTSIKASSVLLEQAGIFIAEEYGAKVSVETLENAIRNGKESILLLGDRVVLAPFLKKASETLSSVTATSIQKALRVESMSPDVIVLVGGGSNFFQQTIQDAFPRLKVVSPQNPVLLNARGFWLLGAAA
ncbi:ParM/StbA family protein [Acidovorax sp. NO-1]|uniref:ParM/StbA family protein n=1 Tax=Acidovorax sp. NO-1 TaxID=512030 RepID=UPI0005596FE0|nr:ParM/StbA family protein [Acidovorax sp. NO-1]